MISKAHLKHHLVCVSRDNKKSLRAALHHPLDVNRYQHAVNSLVEPDDVDRDEGVDEDDMVRPLICCALPCCIFGSSQYVMAVCHGLILCAGCVRCADDVDGCHRGRPHGRVGGRSS